ncbi:hypothetical protein BJ166DRAFT_502526 [Pestalotiopsis sp. NC0098]|nr:hypothetical protein BJ166DRAFT_502526 [Pestalotiopsis sp. NC0098]
MSPSRITFREPQADKWGVEYSSNGTIVKHLVLELKGGLDHRLSWESSASAASNGSKKSDRMQVKDKKMDQKMVKMMKKKQKEAEAEAEKRRKAKVHVKQPKSTSDQAQAHVKQTKVSVDKAELKLHNDMAKMLARRQQEIKAELKRKQTPYHNENSALCSLAEAPYKCCPISKDGWKCPLHPRDPPLEYWTHHIKTAKQALRRAYRVQLFLIGKKYQHGVIALHKERRRELNLADLPVELDFPEVAMPTAADKSRLLGKLCLSHRLRFDVQRRGAPRQGGPPTACWICRYDNLYKQYVIDAHQAYSTYCHAFAEALDHTHRRVQYMCFNYKAPAMDPGSEVSGYSPCTRRVLHITEWAENQKGQRGNIYWLAREYALRADERKAAVWTRMRGAQDYVTVDAKQDRAFKTALESIEEE